MKIEEKIVKYFNENNLHISFAESMTGGMLASTIVSVSGASDILERSFITYSNDAKIDILGVNPKTIDKYDVVSIEVVKEMAYGLKKITSSDVCVSVSGYANGYFKDEEKGKVCYAILYNDELYTNEVIIEGSRNEVRKKATLLILKEIYKKGK